VADTAILYCKHYNSKFYLNFKCTFSQDICGIISQNTLKLLKTKKGLKKKLSAFIKRTMKISRYPHHAVLECEILGDQDVKENGHSNRRRCFFVTFHCAFCHLMKLFKFQMYTMLFTTNQEI
jgi:hypothetical protein